ncbi:nitroreductase family protein [Chelatococcus reniformis]|uniref:NADPH-dependent oxidoreductase n=1 Tax=Chelatococcus reniformis TaxID=1494448 RepID=A0A916UMH9_9HYPH|nr:nitroreductase family protein [Chelatococcus reniformis]GGC77597.1 NADPH-dependent oxidoreductase [Chelatococcus reniformis]
MTHPVVSPIEAALTSRYGDAAAGLAPLWNDTIAALLSHRSVRAFLPGPLPQGTVEAAVAAAQSAPSSSNLQTWSVVAIEDPATKAKLAEYANGQTHVAEAPLVLAFLADLARLEEIGRRRDHPTDALAFLETLLIGFIDAALAAQNAVVALESLGLGTVYLGAIRNRPVEVAELLHLPPNVVAVVGLVVGHPDPARPAAVKPRLPQRVVLHRERYDASQPPDAIDGYDRTLAEFQRGQNLPPAGWIDAALQRVRGPQSLSGRDRLKEALIALGFGLR